jgi:DNA repair protein RadD
MAAVTFELYAYQRDAIDALYAHWNGEGSNPLVVAATGTGKSLIIAWLVWDILQHWPDVRILVTQHVQELITQNVEHLLALWPKAPFGINAAALGRRDWDDPMIFAQVQSICRTPEKLGKRHIMIVDEAHMIPRHETSMYRQVIAVVKPNDVTGFTATEYRLDSGLLTEGESAIFDKIVFNFGIKEATLGGYLVPCRSKRTQSKIDVSDVAIRGGEFVLAQLEAAANTDDNVLDACREILAKGEGRRIGLIFCCGVNHAFNVARTLRGLGETAATVTGETPQEEREDLIARFKRGDIRFMTNVNVLTTGSNIPGIDLIALLRPTLSTGLYVQMVGRGTRLAPDKADCLVLDFAGNVRRHGPVDNVDPKTDASRLKTCPQCDEIVVSSVAVCPHCGFVWPAKEKQERTPPSARQPLHSSHADEAPVQLAKYVPEWLAVQGTRFPVHYKYGNPLAPPSLRVEYLCGFTAYREFICFQHEGYAREKAHEWWRGLGGDEPVPATVAEAFARRHELEQVAGIMAVPDGKWWRIRERRLSDGSIIGSDCRRWTPPKPELIPFNDKVQF